MQLRLILQPVMEWLLSAYRNLSEVENRARLLLAQQRSEYGAGYAAGNLINLLVQLKGLCRKDDLRTGNPYQSLFLIGQFQKVETPTLWMLAHHVFQRLELALCESCSLPQNLSRFVVLC